MRQGEAGGEGRGGAQWTRIAHVVSAAVAVGVSDGRTELNCGSVADCVAACVVERSSKFDGRLRPDWINFSKRTERDTRNLVERAPKLNRLKIHVSVMSPSVRLVHPHSQSPADRPTG